MDDDTSTNGERGTEKQLGTDSATNITTDRETVQTWVESNGAKPAFRTDEASGRTPYIYYPDTAGEAVEETSWEEFFEYFEDRELALVRYGDRPNEGPGQLELVDRTRVYEETKRDAGVKQDAGVEPVETGASGEAEGREETTAETTSSDTVNASIVSPSNKDVGKQVVNASGENVGVVTEVDEDAALVYVDPNPGITDRIKTRLGWESRGEDAYTVSPDHIEAIEDDEMRLKSL